MSGDGGGRDAKRPYLPVGVHQFSSAFEIFSERLLIAVSAPHAADCIPRISRFKVRDLFQKSRVDFSSESDGRISMVFP